MHCTKILSALVLTVLLACPFGGCSARRSPEKAPAHPPATAGPSRAGGAVRTLTGHNQRVTSVAFCPDGRLLASGSRDVTVRLWEVATGREVRSMSGHGAGNDVTGVAFSPDGLRLASVSMTRGVSGPRIIIWDVATGRQVLAVARFLAGDVLCVAFSPDGQLLAAGLDGAGTIIVGARSGQEIWSSQHPKPGAAPPFEVSTIVHAVAFSPDGRLVAAAATAGSALFEVASGRAWRLLPGSVGSVTFSPDGRLLAGGGDGRVTLWEVASGRQVRVFTDIVGGVRSVAFSPEGQLLAAGSTNGTIRLWEVASGRGVTTPARHQDRVSSLAFSPDGHLLASGSFDKTVKLWRVP